MPLKDQDLKTWKEKIPKHWQVKRLGDVAQYINGRGFKSSEWKKKGIPIIRIQNLNNPDALYNYAEDDFDQKYQILKGDMLFSWSASIDAYIWKGEKAWLNQHIFKVEENSELCKKFYLFYYLKKIIREFYSAAHGSGMVHITKKSFESTPIPIPPLAEQQTIVAKIEELFSELEKGKEQLETALAQLKVYRQSLLQAAFSGKLTHPDVKEGELPEGWKWVKLGEVANITDGDHQAPPKETHGIPFITISNVNKNTNRIDFSETFKVGIEYYKNLKESRKPQKGDVLYTVTGSFGIPILIDFERDFCFQRHIGLVRPLNGIDQKWIYYLLQSPEIYNQAKKTATGTAQKTVGLSSLRNFEVPYSEIHIQQEIVQILESKLTVCDKIEETIKQSLAQADVLRQSILKQAFEGKLVGG